MQWFILCAGLVAGDLREAGGFSLECVWHPGLKIQGRQGEILCREVMSPDAGIKMKK